MLTWLRLAPLCALVACTYKEPDELVGPEAPPTIGFEFPTSGADEATGTVKIPVVLSKPSDVAVTATYAVLNGGGGVVTMATPAQDFLVSGSTIQFAPGEVRATIDVQILSDTDETESDEQFAIALADPVGATLDADSLIHEVQISDHLLPRIRFMTAATSTFTEGGAQTTLTLLLVNAMDGMPQASEGDSTVVVGINPGTNPPDTEDLAFVDGTQVMIPNGATSVDIDLAETNDAFDEEDIEDCILELKGASTNLVLNATDILHPHEFADNDDPPDIKFDVVSSNVDENGATVLIAVSLTAESARTITVDYGANAGSTAAVTADAAIVGTSLTFDPHRVGVTGDTTKMITVNIVDDATDEDAEDLIIDLSNEVNANLVTPSSHTLTINADNTDPAPTVTFNDPDDTVDEDDGNNNGSTAVVLSAASGKMVQVSMGVTGTATNGVDYVTIDDPTVLTFMPGTTQINVTVDVIRTDPSNEGTETVILDLKSPSNASLGAPTTRTYTLTILE
jgi:hypothetical protein